LDGSIDTGFCCVFSARFCSGTAIRIDRSNARSLGLLLFLLKIIESSELCAFFTAAAALVAFESVDRRRNYTTLAVAASASVNNAEW